MISASESGPLTEKDGCVVAAISMPRSSAAVLTLVSTPCLPESFAFSDSDDTAEAPGKEGDRGERGGFWSGAIRKGITSQDAVESELAFAPCRRLGYHVEELRRNPVVRAESLGQPHHARVATLFCSEVERPRVFVASLACFCWSS